MLEKLGAKSTTRKTQEVFDEKCSWEEGKYQNVMMIVSSSFHCESNMYVYVDSEINM